MWTMMIMQLPSIPGWDGVHPAMVQFAIVPLFAAPLLLLVSLFARQTWRTWLGAALLLMAIGTLATWLAVGSGHAAGQLVDKTPVLDQAIAQHEAFGILMRTVFTAFTLVLALFALLPTLIKKPLPAALRISSLAVFLVVYAASTVVIGNTAQRGGRLVHELGVRAMVDASTQQATAVGEQKAAPERPRPAPIPVRKPAP